MIKAAIAAFHKRKINKFFVTILIAPLIDSFDVTQWPLLCENHKKKENKIYEKKKKNHSHHVSFTAEKSTSSREQYP